MASYTDAQGNSHPLPTATQDMIVHDSLIGIDRKIMAGTPVPPDLLDAYYAAGGQPPTSARLTDTPPSAPAPTPPTPQVDLEALTIPDLRAIAVERNVDLGTVRSKPEIVSLLVAAETAPPSPGV